MVGANLMTARATSPNAARMTIKEAESFVAVYSSERISILESALEAIKDNYEISEDMAEFIDSVLGD